MQIVTIAISSPGIGRAVFRAFRNIERREGGYQQSTDRLSNI